MRILGIIPARGGSKGLPGKNKKLMLGKPLICYTIEAALYSKLTSVVVSSDDDEILRISEDAGLRVFKRPADLSSDLIPTLPVLQHVIGSLSEEYDAVMTLQPTSPLRTFQHINEAIGLFEKHGEADSLVSIVQAPHKFTSSSLMVRNGVWVNPIDADSLVLRRQDKPVLWGRNGAAIYITRINKLEDYIFGGKILHYEMSKLVSVDIDDMDDWKIAESILYYEESNIKNKKLV